MTGRRDDGKGGSLHFLVMLLLPVFPSARLPVLVAQRTPDPISAQRRTVIGTAAARVAPAVVNVNVVRRQRTLPRDIFEQMLIPRGYEQIVEGLGTGFLISADGLIITNQHVTAGADQIVVTLRDGRDFPARLLGEDDRTDIAVVKIDNAGTLPVAPIGRSRALQIGDWLVAIGNPYGFLLGNSEPSVTAGVASALGRDVLPSADQSSLYVDMIQTDAAINPGNSGGPLIDADGEVVGVNTFILSQSGGSVGLGFAIPIERAMKVAREIAEHGRVRRGWVGIDVAGPTELGSNWRHQQGLQVQRVAPGGAGERAGIQPGDRIDRINGQPVRTFLAWEKTMLDLAPGDTLQLAVTRGTDTRAAFLAASDLPSVFAERVSVRDLQLITVTPAIQAERRLRYPFGALIVDAPQVWQRSAGIQSGDVILQVNNYRISQAEQVSQLIDYYRGRSALRFIVARGDQVLSADLGTIP
jgi:serine protease Do